MPELVQFLPKARPTKPTVFVLGNGVWNDLNEAATQRWLRQLEATIVDNMPWLRGGIVESSLLDVDRSGDDKDGSGIHTAPDESIWPDTGHDPQDPPSDPRRYRAQKRSTTPVAGTDRHKGTGNNGDPNFPRLFITPTASGRNKPPQFVMTQGHIALQRFEGNMGPWVKEQGYDHLGVYNLTIQNSSPDGT